MATNKNDKDGGKKSYMKFYLENCWINELPVIVLYFNFMKPNKLLTKWKKKYPKIYLSKNFFDRLSYNQFYIFNRNNESELVIDDFKYTYLRKINYDFYNLNFMITNHKNYLDKDIVIDFLEEKTNEEKINDYFKIKYIIEKIPSEFKTGKMNIYFLPDPKKNWYLIGIRMMLDEFTSMYKYDEIYTFEEIHEKPSFLNNDIDKDNDIILKIDENLSRSFSNNQNDLELIDLKNSMLKTFSLYKNNADTLVSPFNDMNMNKNVIDSNKETNSDKYKERNTDNDKETDTDN